MDAEIRPEPGAEERMAILRVLESELARDALPPAYRSAWRELGIRENSGEDDAQKPD